MEHKLSAQLFLYVIDIIFNGSLFPQVKNKPRNGATACVFILEPGIATKMYIKT
jgi:hypothetical protein